MEGLPLVLALAATAGLAPLAGAALALWHKPSTLLMSVALGFAGGALVGTATFEMVPRSIELAHPAVAIAVFAAGYAALYALDLVIQGGRTAGEHADRRQRRRAYRRSRKSPGDKVTVLGAGTLIEEIVEGATIGASASVEPGLAAVVALAIALDSLSEGASIAELAREKDGSGGRARALKWTGAMGVAMSVATLTGYLLLRGMPGSAIGGLLAFGAGGLLYLTITKLIPEGEARHYEQSAAVAAGAGLVLVMVLQLVVIGRH